MKKNTNTTQTAAPAPVTPVMAATAQFNQATGFATQILAAIGSLLQGPLTTKQRQALLKAQHAGMAVIPALVDLAAAKPNLLPAGITAQQIQDSIAILQVVVTFSHVVSGIASQVNDTVRVMQDEVYRQGLDIYAIAERNTQDPNVKAVVEKMKAALATGPRLKKYTRTPVPKTKLVRVPADSGSTAPASNSSTAVGNGTSTGSSSSTAPTATAPQVPVYTPGGQAGTAPATNNGSGN